MLDIQGLTVRYGPLTIADDIRFTVEPGQWLMIVGPNGAGKSTIINAISQGVPYTGTVSFDGCDVAKKRPAELARDIGVLTQNHFVGYSFTVEEVVRLGRYAYAPGVFSTKRDKGEQLVEEALEKTGLQGIRKQSVLTLSGGELQRTFLAQVFAQNPRLLLLDEPTNHLDLVYQQQVFGLIREWLREPGRAVISVVHDLSLARAYGTHALLLNHGKVVTSGKVTEVLSPENLNSVYGMDVYEWMRNMFAQWQGSTAPASSSAVPPATAAAPSAAQQGREQP